MNFLSHLTQTFMLYICSASVVLLFLNVKQAHFCRKCEAFFVLRVNFSFELISENSPMHKRYTTCMNASINRRKLQIKVKKCNIDDLKHKEDRTAG